MNKMNERFKVTNIAGSPTGAVIFLFDKNVPLWFMLSLAAFGVLSWTGVVLAILGRHK